MDNFLVEEFRRAANRVKGPTVWRTLDRNQKLTIYGLYKQGGNGDCNKSKPSFFNISARRKWDAWNSRRGTHPDAAMKLYIEMVEEIESVIGLADST